MDDAVKAAEERATERAFMRIDAEADAWLAGAPEFRKMIEIMSSMVAGPFKERAAAQLDAMVRNTFVEAFYLGFNAHKDGAAAVAALSPATGRGEAEAMREAAAKLLETDVIVNTVERFVFDGRVAKNEQGHERFVSTENLSDWIRQRATAIRALPTGGAGHD